MFGKLLHVLENLVAATSKTRQNSIIHITPVVSELPGPNRGCPCLKFDTEWLADAMSLSHHIPLQALAQALGVHRNTLRHHLQMSGLSKQYSNITDEELDVVICHYKQDCPNAGL
ncbi:hypothetical protein JVU11DRAFT_5993 [Chiua virens]|nr:hypothetical protein JVU11DRAFT_5993 [Chiua virens]